MHHRTALLIISLIAAACATSRNPPAAHRVVMEVSSDSPKVWEALMNNAENLQKSLGSQATSIEIVAHGAGLALLMKGNETHAERLARIAGSGVVLAACENTMKRKSITREALLPFVTTVDSGVAEVVRKQEQGWSYVKSGF